MNLIRTRSNRGFTMMEMVMAIGISGLIFMALGMMVFFSSRNIINLHDQSLSQSNASNASERVVYMLRNAVHFERVEEDKAEFDLSRLLFRVPWSPKLQLIAYDSVKEQVVWFEDATEATVAKDAKGRPTVAGTPDKKFNKISNFRILWDSAYHVTLEFAFQYRGFALMFSNPGNPQHGRFYTEVIAKNHFPDQGVNDVDYTDDSPSPFALQPLKSTDVTVTP